MLSDWDALCFPLLAFWGVRVGEGRVASSLALAFFFLFFLFFFFGELVGTMNPDDKELLDELQYRALSSAVSASWCWQYQVFPFLLCWVDCWSLLLAFVGFVGCDQANQDLKQDWYSWFDFLGLCLAKKRVSKSKVGITSQWQSKQLKHTWFLSCIVSKQLKLSNDLSMFPTYKISPKQLSISETERSKMKGIILPIDLIFVP
jgi:hypothetical protein